MLDVSVIIPSHNRPVLLREAIGSVCGQTYPHWQVVVVDDGSNPPVDAEALRTEFGSRILVVRNERPMTQPVARDQGARWATGEVVIHLDDDDLLAPTALEEGVAALESDTSLQLVFLNVRGFGEKEQDFNRVQREVVEKSIERAKGVEKTPDLVRFGPELFTALLEGVAMAFQRSMEYRSVWNSVSALRRRVYMLDSAISEEEAMCRLVPPLRESEWAAYAAVMCKTALITTPLYLQRCGGQGYFSVAAQRENALRSKVDIMEHFMAASMAFEEFFPHQRAIRNSLARAHFDQSYYNFYSGRRLAAYHSLKDALKINPKPSYLRFAVRMLLPRGANGRLKYDAVAGFRE